MMAWSSSWAALWATAVVALWPLPGNSSHDIPTYTLDLDLPVLERYGEVLRDFNSSLHELWDFFFSPDTEEGKLLLEFIQYIGRERGPEPDVLEHELEVLSAAFGKPLLPVRGLQTLYELQTLMVPVDNITLPWRGPGCTGIIARDARDGKVYHARNLDFSPKHIMQNLAYNAIFTRNGVEQYRYQTIAGYQLAITGMKRGPNGYTIERNTRYPDHAGGNHQMLKGLLIDKVPLNGWSVRRVFETCDTYECANETLSTVPFASTEYSIISGAQKGTVIARNPTNVAHALKLGTLDVDIKDPNYIIMTNFDFYFHDFREFFDATGGRILRPRRIVAQGQLAELSVYTPENLFNVIDYKGVRAIDTIVQAMMSVESDLYNVTLTDLQSTTTPATDDHVHYSSRKYIERFHRLLSRVKDQQGL